MTIYNHTRITLGFMNKLRVLFGQPVEVSIEIEVAAEVEVVSTKALTTIPSIFPRVLTPMQAMALDANRPFKK